MSFRDRVTVLVGAAVALSIATAAAILFLVVDGQLHGQLDGQLALRASQISAAREAFAARCPDSVAAMSAAGDPPASAAPSATPAPSTPAGSAPPRDGEPAPPCSPPGTPPVPAPRPGDSAGVVQFLTTSGTAVRPNDQATELPISPAAQALATAGSGADVIEDVQVGAVPMRLLTHAFATGGAVQVALPRDGIEQVLANLRLLMLLTALVGVVIAIVLGRAIANSALAPVSRLTTTTERIAGTRDLRERVADPGSDELGRLANSFNRMLAALEESERSRRQLVADASHELRTPLTSLRTNIEVLALDADLPADDRRQLLASLTGETERLSQLVADLMELARGDEIAEPAMVGVNLDELVSGAVAVAHSRYPGVTFVVRSQPTAVVGDPARLRRAIDNLLDNAGKWSPPGGLVDVDVAAGEVSVRDHGPGIAPDDRARVFDRFWRAPAARATPGSGLGLAIAAQTAEAHHGAVRLESPPDGGARFVLSLPAVDPVEG